MISLFVIYVIGCILSYGLSYNFWYFIERKHLPIPIDMSYHVGIIVASSFLSWVSVLAYLTMSVSSGCRIRLKYYIK